MNGATQRAPDDCAQETELGALGDAGGGQADILRNRDDTIGRVGWTKRKLDMSDLIVPCNRCPRSCAGNKAVDRVLLSSQRSEELLYCWGGAGEDGFKMGY